MFRSNNGKSVYGGLTSSNMENFEDYVNSSINMHNKYKIINVIDGTQDQDLVTVKQLNDTKNDGINNVSWNKIINFPITPIASSDLGQLIPSIDAIRQCCVQPDKHSYS